MGHTVADDDRHERCTPAKCLLAYVCHSAADLDRNERFAAIESAVADPGHFGDRNVAVCVRSDHARCPGKARSDRHQREQQQGARGAHTCTSAAGAPGHLRRRVGGGGMGGLSE